MYHLVLPGLVLGVGEPEVLNTRGSHPRSSVTVGRGLPPSVPLFSYQFHEHLDGQ